MVPPSCTIFATRNLSPPGSRAPKPPAETSDGCHQSQPVNATQLQNPKEQTNHTISPASHMSPHVTYVTIWRFSSHEATPLAEWCVIKTMGKLHLESHAHRKTWAVHRNFLGQMNHSSSTRLQVYKMIQFGDQFDSDAMHLTFYKSQIPSAEPSTCT